MRLQTSWSLCFESYALAGAALACQQLVVSALAACRLCSAGLLVRANLVGSNTWLWVGTSCRCGTVVGVARK